MSAGRLGSAWHTADVMLIVASDGADFISGVTFPRMAAWLGARWAMPMSGPPLRRQGSDSVEDKVPKP